MSSVSTLCGSGSVLLTAQKPAADSRRVTTAGQRTERPLEQGKEVLCGQEMEQMDEWRASDRMERDRERRRAGFAVVGQRRRSAQLRCVVMACAMTPTELRTSLSALQYERECR